MEDKIENFICEYQDIWWKVDNEGSNSLPCMDSGSMIDEYDYYGCDFTGPNKTYMLFFTGSSDCFPGIPIGENNEDDLDKYPIYLYDLSSDDDNPITPTGKNFRQYITTILEDFTIFTKKKRRKKYTKLANNALDEIKKFSNELKSIPDPVLKIIK